MKYYSIYHEDNDSEKSIQIDEDAIERKKREISIHFDYIKIDEQIITKVYKLSDNEIIHITED